MNYITKLEATEAHLNSKLCIAVETITDFMAFLQSPKFTGTETVIDREAGDWVDEQSHEESKDWISTGDVLKWLTEFRSQLQE